MKLRHDHDGFDEYYLEAFRGLVKHESIGIARAMYYCKTHQICPPAWLVEKTATLLIDLLRREKGLGKGRPNRLARFRTDYATQERWEALESVSSIRTTHRNDDRLLKETPKFKAEKNWKKAHEKRGKWLDQGPLRCAADILEQKRLSASASTIKKSHAAVEAAIDQGTDMTTIWLDDDFLEKLGVKRPRAKTRATKS